MVTINGINFSNLDTESALNFVFERIERKEKTIIVTPNAEIAYQCKRDKNLLDTVNSADLILPDGIGIVYAAKILNEKPLNRIPGIDFATEMLKIAENRGNKIFLLGAKPGIAEAAAKNLKNAFKNLNICGVNDGYFKNSDDVIKKINSSQADIVFVCLGFPNQELFMQKNKQNIQASVMIGLGGSLDVFAGNVKRAPVFFRKLGLEWFYRLITQPARFFRMLKLPLFVLDILKYKFFKKD